MTSILFRGAGEVATADPTLGEGPAGVLPGAAVAVADGLVAWVGPEASAPPCDQAVDLDGRALNPGFVDSHTHLVFAGERSAEFAARMAGRPYAAGGILTTVAATRAASEETLAAGARRLRDRALAQGTTTVEIKTGYGLEVAAEARLARVAATLTSEVTFLGAHVVPPEHAADPDAYVDLVCGPMLAAVTAAAPVRWIDVFVERGAFDLGQAARVLRAGRQAGLGLRLHAAQLGASDAIGLAVAMDAASVDHGTHLTPDDVTALAHSRTVLTLLPGAEFSTRQPHPSGRALLDAGVELALASDCNPGTSFTTSMPFQIALAVQAMGLTPAEARAAATRGGAAALRRPDIGRLAPGCRADLVDLDAPSHIHLAYRPGERLARRVWLAGREY
jgi:imidazolonepropionase